MTGLRLGCGLDDRATVGIVTGLRLGCGLDDRATVGIVTGLRLGCRLDDRATAARHPAETRDFVFSEEARPEMGPTQPPTECIPGALSQMVKRPRHEADRSRYTYYRSEESVELYLHSTCAFMACCLVEHRNFTFTFIRSYIRCGYRI